MTSFTTNLSSDYTMMILLTRSGLLTSFIIVVLLDIDCSALIVIGVILFYLTIKDASYLNVLTVTCFDVGGSDGCSSIGLVLITIVVFICFVQFVLLLTISPIS